MNTYGIGTRVQVTGTFRDITGNLIDPTTVVFEVCRPDKEIETASTTSSSTGVYTAEYVPPLKGGYTYKMRGNGSCEVTAYGYFNATGDF